MSQNSLEIEATFDGEVFRPTQPVRLKPDTPVHLVVRAHADVTDVGDDAQARHEALLRLAGTWTEKDVEEFYEATEWTRRIEPEDWK